MKRIQSSTLLALLVTAASFSFIGCQTQEKMHAGTSASTESYPLTKCVVSGEDLGDKPYVFVHNGQQVKLCCKDCLAKFNKEPEKYHAQIHPAK